MQAIFLNEFGRLRSGWRALIFLFLFWFVSTRTGAAVFTLLIYFLPGFNQNDLLFFLANNFLYGIFAIIFGWLCGKYIEGLPLRTLGWTFSNNWFKHLILGLLFGTFSILMATTIAYVFGGIRFQWNETAGGSAILATFGTSLLIFIMGSLSEETLFRGYILQTFARAKLAWFAIIMTSLFFASAHLGNPNSSKLSSLNTGLAGILFGAAYLKTRTLWFPFGLHLMWNWVQGAFLGITVSGIKELVPAPLLQLIDSGPMWLTGGEYGIEGGIACTIALIATTLLIWFTPILKPTEEMLALTDQENPRFPVSSES